MKKYFCFSIMIIFFIGCDADPTSSGTDESELPVVIKNLSGKWNWIQSVDSTGQLVDEPTLNNTMSIEITQDYTFRQYRNDTLFFNDKFNLSKTVLPNKNDTLTFMDWRTSRRFNYIIFSLTSKTLLIGYRLSNNYKEKYSRIN